MRNLSFSLLALFFTSCEVVSDVLPSQKLGGEPSALGEVGNTFTLGTVSGVNNFSAEVRSQEGDISEITGSFTMDDPTLLEIIKNIPDVLVNGSTVSATKKYRLTTEGIQSIYEDGEFIMVKYGDNVGKSYSYKKDGKNLKREVTYKSSEDDYRWAFWDIKVIRVVETGRGIPGVKNLEYIANHKFGLVGFKVTFEDGSEKEVRFFSRNDV